LVGGRGVEKQVEKIALRRYNNLSLSHKKKKLKKPKVESNKLIIDNLYSWNLLKRREALP